MLTFHFFFSIWVDLDCNWFSTRIIILHLHIKSIGNASCTNDVSNPTAVYVVQGGKAVLQCEFESSKLLWRVYNVDSVDIIAAGGLTIDNSKYNVSKNPLTGLYYKLHILNVGDSDLKKYRCQGLVQQFYLQLILFGRCNYILVSFKVGNRDRTVWSGECKTVVVAIL